MSVPLSERTCSVELDGQISTSQGQPLEVVRCSVTMTAPGTAYLSATGDVGRSGATPSSVAGFGFWVDDEFLGENVFVHANPETHHNLSMQSAVDLEPGTHVIEVRILRLTGPGPASVSAAALNVVVVPEDNEMVTCGRYVDYGPPISSTAFTPIVSCELTASRSGTLVVLGSTEAVWLDGAFEAAYQLGVDSVRDDFSTRWVNVRPIDDPIPATYRSVAVQGSYPVGAGTHTVEMHAARLGGSGDFQPVNLRIRAFFVPDESREHVACAQADDGTETVSSSFVVSVSCTLTTPAPARVVITAGGSVGTGTGGTDFTAAFATGVDGQVHTLQVEERQVSTFQDGGDGNDEPVLVEQVVDVAAGTHTFSFHVRRVAGPGSVKVYNPRIQAVAFLEPVDFVPVVPDRVLDTREQVGYSGPKPVVGQSIELQVTGVGAANVPADAKAVVLNVTGTEATADGFVTVWPCDATRPTASNLNLTANATSPNLVIVKLGAGGKVCLFTQSGTHLIADVSGYMPAGSRFVPVVPQRVLETRPEGQVGFSGPKPGVGQELTLGLGTVVPAQATAVVLNVTGVEATADGFVTVWPCGTARPNASNLNLTAGSTIPNLVVSGLGAGASCLFTQSGTHFVADLSGYMVSGSRYVSVVPDRVLDTRSPGPIGYAGSKPAAGQVVELQVTGVGTSKVPSFASAVTLNVTGTDASADGFVTVWPCGAPRPNASNLNLRAGGTSSNLAMVKIGTDGKVCLFTQTGTDLIADINGYWS
ncbi:MAG: hypothetical protein AB7L17_00625 [Ilumatobacteraceae bacterium]